MRFLSRDASDPTTSSKIFQTFQCYTLDDDEGSSFLRADFSVDCSTYVHGLMRSYAILMVFVYPIGMPVLYVYLLNVRYGKQVHRLRDISALRCALEDVALRQAAYDSSAPDSDRNTRGSSMDRKSRVSMRSAAKASTSFWTWIVRTVRVAIGKTGRNVVGI